MDSREKEMIGQWVTMQPKTPADVEKARRAAALERMSLTLGIMPDSGARAPAPDQSAMMVGKSPWELMDGR